MRAFRGAQILPTPARLMHHSEAGPHAVTRSTEGLPRHKNVIDKMPYARSRKTRSFKRTRRAPAKAPYRKRVAAAPRRARPARRPTTFRARTLVKPARGVQRGYLPFPAGGYFARLPYVDESYLSADGTAGTSAVVQYRLNSVYDPAVAVGGNQPLQYDTLTALYSTYLVHGAKVMITFTNPSADGMYVGYRVRSSYNTTVSSGVSIPRFKELSDQQLVPVNNTGAQVRTLTFYVPIYQILGVTQQQYKNDYTIYGASTAANPSMTAFLDVVAFSTIAGNTDTVRYSVKIVYYTQFSAYVSPAQS